MLKNVEWSIDGTYRTGGDNEPLEFYLDALSNSATFDLLLGYFSSTAISVLSPGFARFLSTGGTMRMVVNDILSQEDKEAVKKGQAQKVSGSIYDLSDIKCLKNILDSYGKHFFECLAWLIGNQKLQIKIIRPKKGKGIAHYKSGVFTDGNHSVGFKASCNFTAFGLIENLEELDTYISWENGRSNQWIDSQNLYFESIYTGCADFVEQVDITDVQIAIKNEFGNKDINELLIQEKDLLEKKKNISSNKKLRKIIERAEKQIDLFVQEPRFPYIQGPREYQETAYQRWRENGYKGIFAMATGTGKTITSLNCVLNEYRRSKEKVYHALILVPTITLVEQWEKEAHAFNFQEVIKVSSKYEWEEEVGTRLSTAKRIPTSFIIISTYATFLKDKFQNILRNLPPDTIFIADEGHNLASLNVLAKLNHIRLEKRIGLSATPKRVYDPEGTSVMEAFFHDQEPYTFSFPMDRAIQEGILCKYYYYPHIVTLTNEELTEYVEITKTLSKFYNAKADGFSKNEVVERLLLKRKRIIHKAANKLASMTAILQEEYHKTGNLQYTFIYVPEGKTEEVFENDTGEAEEINLINQYTRAIGRINESITVNQFISGMPNRNEILKQFQSGDIAVIASMKCLDEGVDIPRAEKAIFCSSTGNPRQFIQRRGRILRRHPDKHQAVIHDLVVVPDYQYSQQGSDTYQTERNMIKTELQRVMYFASLAINPYYTEDVFKDVCNHYGLNIYTIQSELQTV
ncbi:DEAD/DEAH box helicase family protein [Flavisolibacter sp. BT320]|nr:DEAD/DEAH box helicase family protein [Flavisolibacter longurius]